MDAILPLLRGAVERGVRVNVFTRPERQQPCDSLRERLKELRTVATRVVVYHNMHQKLVIVDQSITMVGSLNMLSHRDTREVMVEYQGQGFASNMLRAEHAEHFAKPPRCGTCKSIAELHRLTDEGSLPWSWRCGAPRRCNWTQDATPPERFSHHSA